MLQNEPSNVADTVVHSAARTCLVLFCVLLTGLEGKTRDAYQLRRSIRRPSHGHISKTKQDRQTHIVYGTL